MEQNLLQLEDIMDYYISSMPCADREDVSRGMLEAFARHALFLRKSVDWCRQLPVEVFWKMWRRTGSTVSGSRIAAIGFMKW